MPNPSFLPLIGSSFDSLANQSRGWAGFNADIENQNFARVSQAERERNNWLQQVNALQRQDAASADAADRAAQEEAANRASASSQRGETKREFDLQQGLAEKAQAEKANEFKVQQDAFDKQTKTDLETADALGQHLAPQAKETAQTLKDAIKERDAAIQDFETAKASIPASEKITHGKGGDFVPAIGFTQDPVAQQEAAAANQKVAEAKARFLRSDASHKIAHETWLTLQKTLPKDLVLSPDSTIYNIRSRKMYGEPLKEPVPVAAQDTTLPQPSWMAPMPDAARLSNVPSWMPPNRDLSGPSAVGEDVPVAPDFGMAYAGQDGVIPPASTSTGTNFFAGATAPAAPTGTSSGMVRVIAPNGKPGRIPASQVPAALSAGYRLAVVNVTSN